MAAVTSDEVNYLVYRYLQESGFSHSAFTFAYESLIAKSSVLQCDVPPGALITFLQKGLQLVGIEEHLNEDGTERVCDEEFSLLSAHVCQVTGGARAPGAANSSAAAAAAGSPAAPPPQKKQHVHQRPQAPTADMDVDTENNVPGRGSAAARDGAAARGGSSGTSSGPGARPAAGSSGGAAAPLADTQPTLAPPRPRSTAPPLPPGVEIGPEDSTRLTLHKSEVFMCAWNPNEDLLATGSGDSTARLWPMPIGMPSREAGQVASRRSISLSHSEDNIDRNRDVTTLEWNRAGTLLATGSYDGVARIWNREGVMQHELNSHDGPIFSLKFNNNGNYLLTGSSDRSSIVWDTATGTVKQRFEYHEAPTLDVDWKDDKTFATCSTDKAILVQTVGAEFPDETFTGHTDEVNAIKWDPRCEVLASCSDDGTAKIWRMGHSKCIHDLREHKKEIYTIKWSPLSAVGGPQMLASASFDATVKLWDAERGVVTRTLSRYEDPVYSVAFSPSGNFLASGSFAGHLHIWSMKDGSLVKAYQGEGDIFEVAWNAREDRVAACFSNSHIAVVDFRA